MEHAFIERHFERMGARVRLTGGVTQRRRMSGGLVTLDVQRDAKGEFFDISTVPNARAEIEVLDVQPTDRHLLVLVRENSRKHKFLCGHDERHWFVAAIPESAPVGTVRQAKEALKPAEVQQVQARHRLGANARNRRKNAAYHRQGEWFFLPMPNLVVDKGSTRTNEPISRGLGSKPHWAEWCYRSGGESVYVCNRHPSGVTEKEHNHIISQNQGAKNWGWRAMVRNAAVYVRGRMSHADHKTITLHGWHQVLMNTENQSEAMRNVAFLD